MFFKNIKRKVPARIKNYFKYIYAIIPAKYQFGKNFWKMYYFLQESQWWSKKEFKEYQIDQLEKLIKHAYENVPYYRKIFDERDIKPKDIQDLDDLKKIPFLTKEIVKKNTNDLIAKNFNHSKIIPVSTSGTTGGPMKFYVEQIAMDREWAFMLAQWKRVGFQIGDKRVILRGRSVWGADKGRFWNYCPKERSLILSTHRMSHESLPEYIKKIKEFKPKYIHAYPSSVTILAKWMKENDEPPLDGLEALLCGSENFYKWQRDLLEDVFQCRAFSWYGHSEQAVMGSECEYNSSYHLLPEYGLTELIGKDGKDVIQDSASSEIVATGFNNYVFPFIRYKTQDIGIYSKMNCRCGRNYPLIKNIEGRVQDFFVARNGQRIPFSGYYLTLKVSDNIDKFQYYQDQKGFVILRIVGKKEYTVKDTNKILKELSIKYGDALDFQIEIADDISCDKSGKYKYLIQKLPVGFSH